MVVREDEPLWALLWDFQILDISFFDKWNDIDIDRVKAELNLQPLDKYVSSIFIYKSIK